jgi:LuxR family transcriptional regulator
MTAFITRSFLADEVVDGLFLQDLTRIVEATDPDTVWAVLTRRLAKLGFDRLLYGLTRCRTERSFGDPQDMLILSNHPPAYLDGFIGDGMYFHAPMMRWCQENTGACSWRWMAENRDHLTPAEARVVAFNRRMGVVAGYSISFPHSTERSRGAMALTAARGMTQSEADRIWAVHGDQILALCNVAHLKLMTQPHHGQRRPLTERQREVLEWVGDGKTTQDIAQIMGLTAATIEKHLRLARETLDVDTTAQAIMKASMSNQIFLPAA